MKTQLSKPSRSRARYTEEYKKEALELWRNSGRSAAKVAAGHSSTAALSLGYGDPDRKDFAATPLHAGGRMQGDPYTNTTVIWPFPKLGNYIPWGVGMSEARYDMQMINKDLGRFRDFHQRTGIGINAVIMTPRGPSGSRTAQQPPFYYDAERDAIYGSH